MIAKITRIAITAIVPHKTNLVKPSYVFLKSLLGLHIPEQGTISFDNKIYSDLSKSEKIDLRVIICIFLFLNLVKQQTLMLL